MPTAEPAVVARHVLQTGRSAVICCPAHDDRRPSLHLSRSGDGRLLWRCHAGCEQEAVRAALLGAGVDLAADPTAPAAAADDWRPRVWPEIFQAWDHGHTIDEAPAMRAYLASRGLHPDSPDRLMLRFHPRVLHGHRVYLPAMLAPLMVGPRLVGLHCTYLKPDGSGKADIAPPRKVWKPGAGIELKGSAIPLYPIRAPGLAFTYMAVAEGIETALALRKLKPGLPVWATVSAGGMAALALPSGVRHLLVGADNDATGMQAARQLAKRAAAAGVRAVVSAPPSGDWADVVAA